ncbi:MAG: riboflavin biosynthesis protein RibF [Candidatus Krumholzibacteria bacterium]
MGSPIIARSLAELRSPAPKNSAVTLGVFDGVHLGHREIIRELIHVRNRKSVDGCYLITFDPHPVVVTHSRMTPPMLTTIDERLALLGSFDLDGIVVLEFNRELADLDYRSFIENYLLKPFDMKVLVLGYDCYFGKNREGSPEKAGEEGVRLGYETTVVPALQQGNAVVSSTKIRNALMKGDVAGANELLGHPYLLTGTVVRGHGKGHELGFPTANLAVPDAHKLWPPRGVYAVKVEYRGQTLHGMMNVGSAPTIKALGDGVCEAEVHLFEFEGDLYGERLDVYCCAYLREERRFPSPGALVEQLEADRLEAIAQLAKHT